ncbi:hypothetical protein CVIRNUC_005980 [Coccomyxa viridis]|uniref:Nuclear transcription factor Y subunit n=1 Tax=Coccomyxa viridis TaxID=1274662 RepID=A0AAV1I8D0_9CHLO|nr:hypothetical protein CVIRNUC_005980 [Coccomyxa viridis]
MIPSHNCAMSSAILEADQEIAPAALNSLSGGGPQSAGSSSLPVSEHAVYTPLAGQGQVSHDAASVAPSAPAQAAVAASEYYYQPATQAYQYDPYYGGLMYNPAMGMGAPPAYMAAAASGQQQRMALPGESVGEEEPVYVNAKQYHCILRRRQQRAKAEAENKLVKTRRPYLHQSRHNHAARRVRGPGGRFLTADEVRALQASGELSGGSASASLSAPDRPGDSQGQAESAAHPQPHPQQRGHLRTLSEAGNLAYRNPQGPGNAVEGAAAVYAHESQEAGAMPAMVMPAAVGTSQSTAEQAGPDLGMPAVRVV